MRVDAHQHFWKHDAQEYDWIGDGMEALRRDFLPSDLDPELRRSGFEGCVAVQVRSNLEETRWLLDLADWKSWPVCTLAAGYGRTMGLVTDYLARRTAAEREAICGGNALRFWNLTIEETKT